MEKRFQNDHYYPVDMRLGIIYDDPYADEADCGLGSKKYHGLGTIGIKGIHLSNSEMYQDFRVDPARTESSVAYMKWEKSGFHTFINPDEGLDTKPMRPTGLDILRNCTHTTDGTVCVDCLRKAAEAEKILIRDRIENSKTLLLNTKPQRNIQLPDLVLGDGLDQETEVFSSAGDVEDETALSDPIEAALLRLEFGTRIDSRRQDVATVRAALDKTFSLQQQLSDAQRNTRRALLAEIQRTTEDVDQLIEKLVHITAERDTAQQEAAQTRHHMNMMLVQRDKLLELNTELLGHFKIENKSVELSLPGQVYMLDADNNPALLKTVFKLWEFMKTFPSLLRQNRS